MKFLTFRAQLYGLTPQEIPADLTDRPSHFYEFGTGFGTAADPNPQLPAARPTPRLYVLLNRKRHPVLELNYCNLIDFARCRHETSVDILGNGDVVNIEFQPDDKYPSVYKNSTGDLYEYYPEWFWLDNDLHWAPMALEMCHALSKAKQEGQVLCKDKERDYDLVSFNQINRVTGMKRPIMYLRDDGSAIRGESMALWGYKTDVRGVPGTSTFSFAVAQVLEKALSEGKDKIDVDYEVVSGFTTKFHVTLAQGKDEHVANVDGKPDRPEFRYTFIRFFPTWFYLGDNSRWIGFDYATTSLLDSTCAFGNSSSNDHEREFDLLRLMQRNVDSKKFRPLLQVRGYSGLLPAGNKNAVTMFPEVYARAAICLKKKDNATLKAKIGDVFGTSDVERILYFVCGLIHEHRCAVKGGIIRDAVVKNDVSQSHDIDVELPQCFQQSELLRWIDKFTSLLEKQYDVKVDPTKQIARRSTSDIFGAGGQRVMCEDGMITIPLLFPGGLTMDLECVTPFNTSYSPPRNVDVSVNNLRMTADSEAMAQNVSFPYDTVASATAYKDPNAPVKPKACFSVNQIIQQILDNECTPSYDFAWQAGSGNETGEGINGNKWCIGSCPISHFRTKVMNQRFVKMRSKGYKMVEEPRR